ncbi:hypothetical protein Mal15_08210 [Stieleria maiorica]|uniref:HYDIN/VesB/CFA65-like Ig-like domain-containing protein n=1 Tax=Stieleria maiorica TaxID=2795974 RepID=A0A5B9M6J3_9BACT|nr:DUF1573 domain-containing protein [Stieleria maiorica]QEF96791.1 hypothetical protein Mal15_08210 [Stieleria maiorica]
MNGELAPSAGPVDFPEAAFQSPWMMVALTLIAVWLCINATKISRSNQLVVGVVASAALIFAFLFTRSKLEVVESRPTSRVDGGPLRFEQTEYDFGKLVEGQSETKLVHLVNVTGHDIQLKEMRTNCVCTTATPIETVVPANGKIGVNVSFSSMLEGANRYAIKAIGLEGQEARCEVVFKGSSPLNIAPERHFFGAFSYSTEPTKLRVLDVELTHFYGKAIGDVGIGPVGEDEPFSISVARVYGENRQRVELEFGLNSDVHYEGFVFQDVPLVVELDGQPATAFLNVGADFVE